MHITYTTRSTRRGPTGAPFILSTCDILKTCSKRPFILFDGHSFRSDPYFSKSGNEKGEMRFLYAEVLYTIHVTNENVRQKLHPTLTTR